MSLTLEEFGIDRLSPGSGVNSSTSSGTVFPLMPPLLLLPGTCENWSGVSLPPLPIRVRLNPGR